MIDWNRVSELRTEIGADDFAEIAEVFLEEVDEVIESLAKPGPKTNWAGTLHFLKGSALNLGFSDFASLCADCEHHLKCGAFDQSMVEGLFSSYESSRALFSERI